MTTDEVRELVVVVRSWADTALCYEDGNDGDALYKAVAILERLADDNLAYEHRLMTVGGYRNTLMGEE